MIKCLAIGIIVLTTAVGSARANIVFNPNPPPPVPGTEENIQFETQIPGTSIAGDTSQTQQPVIFDTVFAKPASSNGTAGAGQTIDADGIGAANIICSAGCINNGGNLDNQLITLEMRPGNNTAWTDVEANPDFGEGTMNVFVQDNLGNNFDFMLGNGQNKFSLTATNGEVITDLQMTELGTAVGTETFGWNDFKQPKVSGTCTLVSATSCTPIPPVPEPASLALLGSGLFSFWLMRRRRG